jgi:prepilin-type N-terminal cleavage/methylation domain-containing protein
MTKVERTGQWRAAGFTLIELMMVVAIIGIMAVIAIPTYLDYAARSKVSELEGLLGGCKTSVAEFYQANKRLPVDLAESGCNGQATRYSTSTVVTNGAIAIEAQNILAGDVDGKVLGMRPYCSGVACDTLGAYAPITQWRCDAMGSPTTIAAAYLPAPCR